jgi:hypothetical protein
LHWSGESISKRSGRKQKSGGNAAVSPVSFSFSSSRAFLGWFQKEHPMNIPSFLALTVASGCFICGCATGPPTKTISIDSDPQGIRVEVNGEDLGKTPTSLTVKTNPEGEFLGSWVNAPVVEFVAYPPADAPGLFKQTKVFQPNGFFRAGDKIPARMFFDLHQKPEHLELNIQNK